MSLVDSHQLAKQKALWESLKCSGFIPMVQNQLSFFKVIVHVHYLFLFLHGSRQKTGQDANRKKLWNLGYRSYRGNKLRPWATLTKMHWMLPLQFGPLRNLSLYNLLLRLMTKATRAQILQLQAQIGAEFGTDAGSGSPGGLGWDIIMKPYDTICMRVIW